MKRFSWHLAGTFLLLLLSASFVLAGHTRIAYVDGCQSMDGRYVVTADYIAPVEKGAVGEWRYTWKDSKEGKTLSGKLHGIMGVGHFDTTYAHVFVAPGGETFAVWNGGSFACPPTKQKDVDAEALRNHPSFADRLIVYRKTGEIVSRMGLKEILDSKEWVYVNWVHGNLYWSVEYPDAVTNGGEAPRAGMRYFRVSPDYTVLEVVIGANGDTRHKLKDAGPEVLGHRRVVRFDLVKRKILPPEVSITDRNKIPSRPFVGRLAPRGELRGYVPSLDPVRVEGRFEDNPKRK